MPRKMCPYRKQKDGKEKFCAEENCALYTWIYGLNNEPIYGCAEKLKVQMQTLEIYKKIHKTSSGSKKLPD